MSESVFIIINTRIRETVFSSRKDAKRRKEFFINNTRAHEIKHDILCCWTFHTMATRSFARWPTEFKHDVAEEIVIGSYFGIEFYLV